MKKNARLAGNPLRPEKAGAVGIVVKDGGCAAGRPRTVAFIWGQRVRSAPSLPYGRWKKDVRSAA